LRIIENDVQTQFVRHLCTAVILAIIAAAVVGCGDNFGVEPPGGDPPGGDPPGGDPPGGDPPVTDAPTAEIVAPAPGAVLAASAVTVRVRVRAEAGLLGATVSAGTVSVAIEPGAFDASGEATVVLGLPDGAHALGLVAEDAEHRSAADQAAIVVDTEAPAITVGAPRADAAETRRLLFTQLADPAGIAAVSYTVNGGAAVSVAIDGMPAQLAVRAALPLVAGPNTVELTVTDGLGHQRRELIAFRYGGTTAAGGAHSGAISAGVLHTWGRYNQGQLGLGGTIGDVESRLAPQAVPAFGAPDTEVAAVAFNQNWSIAVRSDGTLWTWGANGDGQLGHGDTVQRAIPAQVAGLADVVYAHAGFGHGLALRADGVVLAWGNNAAGQSGVDGNGTATDDQLVPVEVAGVSSAVVELAAGSQHSLALTVDGQVWAWGRNEFGNLGLGAADDARHPVPVAVPGLTDVVDIATGRDHVIAVRADGSVVSWGLGASGQLGYGVAADPASEDRASPVVVTADASGAPLRGARAVFANGNTSYALIDVGGAAQYWGWGQNFNGQLAIGATSPEEWFARRAVVYTSGEAPVFLDEQVALSSIGTGATHTIARTKSGQIYAWGWNFRGSLGVPAIANAWAQTVAVEVAVP
jgi:alpha-tubulin suppressor-like RCC1 family protein